MWHQWPDMASFTTWQDSACSALGIPHPNRNAASGDVDEWAQWTTAYTEPVVIADDRVRAVVEHHVARMMPNGLGVPCDPPPVSDDLTN